MHVRRSASGACVRAFETLAILGSSRDRAYDCPRDGALHLKNKGCGSRAVRASGGHLVQKAIRAESPVPGKQLGDLVPKAPVRVDCGIQQLHCPEPGQRRQKAEEAGVGLSLSRYPWCESDRRALAINLRAEARVSTASACAGWPVRDAVGDIRTANSKRGCAAVI